MTLTLHKVGVFSDDEDNHVFTFLLDNVKFMTSPSDVRGLESSEVYYGGHSWSVVCARKEDHYLGVFLKWRYTDGPSLSSVSVKAKYSLTLINRRDYGDSVQFSTTQRFSSGQTLLGKSRLIPVDDVVDQSSGFLDETGKHLVIELSFAFCSTRYEKIVDISPPARTRKNASGIFFDTSTFLLAGHRWYLRFYAKKTNSNGLPAVYLYLSSKSKGVSVELRFTLHLGKDFTEILDYAFGDEAKFEGFGKTLPDPVVNVDRLNEITVSVDIHAVAVTKSMPLCLRWQPSPYSSAMSRAMSSHNGASSSAINSAEAFQDQEGNVWKAQVMRDTRWLTVCIDKGVHHFTNNRTRIMVWSAMLLSRDQQRAADVCMKGNPVVGFFSNFIDDKGYLITFPIQLSDLEDRSNCYIDENGFVVIKFHLLSVQSTPLTLRSAPRFDYQQQHVMRMRQELRTLTTRSLNETRDMSASRGSLSLLDDLSTSSNELYSSANHRSLESLNLSASDSAAPSGEEFCRPFIRSLLGLLNAAPVDGNRSDHAVLTSRDINSVTGSAMSESSSTESGMAANWNEDSTSLVTDARINPVDGRNQIELVAALVKMIKSRVPLRIKTIVELGSVGTGTVARSRSDIDLILISPDVPRDLGGGWLPALLHAIKCMLQLPTGYAGTEQPRLLPAACTDWHVTSHAVQFTCAGLDVDVMVTSDWNESAETTEYEQLFEVTCKQTSVAGRQWYSLGSAQLRKTFLCEQPNEVKELIKVIKHWRNGVQWRKLEFRPNSYLLSLLVIKAVDETKQVDVRQIIQRVGVYVLSSELRLLWNVFYKTEDYPVEFNPPTPLVRDPTNPGFNVAETLSYWGQLRTEYSQWLRSLSISLNRVTFAPTT